MFFLERSVVYVVFVFNEVYFVSNLPVVIFMNENISSVIYELFEVA